MHYVCTLLYIFYVYIYVVMLIRYYALIALRGVSDNVKGRLVSLIYTYMYTFRFVSVETGVPVSGCHAALCFVFLHPTMALYTA